VWPSLSPPKKPTDKEGCGTSGPGPHFSLPISRVYRVGEEYKASVHRHPLKYVEKEGWVCNGMSISGGCKSKFTPSGRFKQTKGERRFRCSDCDYDLCVKCLEAYPAN